MRLTIKRPRITTEYAFVFIMCIFMIRPYYVQVSVFNYAWAYVTLGLSVVGMVMIVRRKRLLKENVLLYAYLLIYLLATFLYESDNTFSAISTIGQVLLAGNIGIWVYSAKHKKTVLSAIHAALVIYLYIDVICGVLQIGQRLLGLTSTSTFLAYDNYAIYLIIPMLAVIFIIDCYLNGKVMPKDWVCYAFCLAYKVISFSVNAIACLALFLLIYLIMKYFRLLRKIFSVRNIIIISVVLLLGIIFFNIHEVLNPIMIALGKGTTLSFRTVIWQHAITAVKDIPLLGYGNLSDGSFQTIVGLSALYDVNANHPHNFYLQLLFDAGFLGLIIYMAMMACKLRHIKYMRNIPMRRIAICGVITYLLAGFFDGYPYTTMFYLLLGVVWSISRWDYEIAIAENKAFVSSGQKLEPLEASWQKEYSKN